MDQHLPISATSSSTESTIGHCIVCGASTWKRCSECSKYGTDYIFFCSVEHQRLIWFLHSRVCGIRSKPFRFPDFSKQELDIAVEAPERSRLKWENASEGLLADVARLEAFVRCHETNSQGGEADTAQLRPLAEHRKIFKARADVFVLSRVAGETWGRNPTDEELGQVLRSDYVSYIAWLQRSAVKNFETFDKAPFFDKFQHLFFVQSAILARRARGVSLDTGATYSLYSEHAYKEWRRYVETEVCASHPEIAKAFLETCDTHLVIPFPARVPPLPNPPASSSVGEGNELETE